MRGNLLNSLGLAVGLVACVPSAGTDSDGESTAKEEDSAGAPVGMTAATTSEDGSDGSSAADTGGEASTDAASSAADSGSSNDDSTGGGSDACAGEFPAIVTDIDATLTTADSEFFMQLGDGNYDPVERAGASVLINAYASRGYRVMYLTARAETLVAGDTGETARELTERWLMEHDFPLDADTTTVVLSPMLVLGPATATYKSAALAELQTAGWRFDYAYGNAATDITAYADVGIPTDRTYIIGPEAGNGGTVAIPQADWLLHTAEQIPAVPSACGGD